MLDNLINDNEDTSNHADVPSNTSTITTTANYTLATTRITEYTNT